jgi:hypothetical protein
MVMANRALRHAGNGKNTCIPAAAFKPACGPGKMGFATDRRFASMQSVGQIVFERGYHPYFLDMRSIAVAILYGELTLAGAFYLSQPAF